MTEPRIIICIKSCKRDQYNGYNDNVRNTWLRDLRGANYCFVLGNGATRLHPDELILDCPDTYVGLPWKTKALCKYIVEQEYDFALLLDTDTFLIPDRFISSGFDRFDYYGYFNGEIGKPKVIYWCLYSWASGGSGYTLSKRAAQLVSEADPTNLSMCPETRIPSEDLFVGQVLGPFIQRQELTAAHDSRFYRTYDGTDQPVEIATHYCSQGMNRTFDPKWMRDLYEKHKLP